jgi:hypothetical protein
MSVESSHMQTEPVRSKKKLKKSAEITDIVKHCMAELRQRDADASSSKVTTVLKDSDFAFGEFVTWELKKFEDDLVKDMLKVEIQNAIMKARMGIFSSFPAASSPVNIATQFQQPPAYVMYPATLSGHQARSYSSTPSFMLIQSPSENSKSSQMSVVENAATSP